MKIFNNKNTPDSWNDKINFVDQNNIALGYDMGQGCCEHADWFITDSPTNKCMDRSDDIKKLNEELEPYYFDMDYFKEFSDKDNAEFDEGGMVVFRITDGKNEKFVHLYNCHNGYYGHGFNFERGNEIIKKDIL